MLARSCERSGVSVFMNCSNHLSCRPIGGNHLRPAFTEREREGADRGAPVSTGTKKAERTATVYVGRSVGHGIGCQYGDSQSLLLGITQRATGLGSINAG